MTATRRQLLAGAQVAAAALALPGAARADARQDEAILRVLVSYSSELVSAYRLALRGGRPAADARRSLERFAAQATQMDDNLRRALAQRGGSPPPRPVAGPAPQSLPRAAYLRATATGEERLVGAWYIAVQRFSDRRLVEDAAGYMAAAGQRLVVLRKLLGLPLVPQAFETGVTP